MDFAGAFLFMSEFLLIPKRNTYRTNRNELMFLFFGKIIEHVYTLED